MTKVTVIIPTYNREDFIKGAIESVLSQTFTDFELLILDDASTDNTEEVVKLFSDVRIKYIHHLANLGIAKNRNYGLSVAQGEYIAMLDSDDLWISIDKLEKQVEFMDLNKDYGVTGTFCKNIDDRKANWFFNIKEILSHLFLESTNFWMRANFLIRNQIYQSSALIRKASIDDVGGYDESLPIWEDYDLWLRIGTKYKVRNIPEFLTGYRIHKQNISSEDKMKGIHASIQILRKHKNKYPNYWLGYLKIFLKKNLRFL